MSDAIEFPWKWLSFGFRPNEPFPPPTRESIAAFKSVVAAEKAKQDVEWLAFVDAFAEKKARMLALAKEIGFPTTRVDRSKKRPKSVGLDETLAQFHPSSCGFLGLRDFDYQIRAVEEWLTKKESADRAKAEVSERLAKVTRAASYLITEGKKMGEDFTVENAIKRANAIAADKACDAAPEFYDDFAGKNCEDCPGWSKGNHRCDCGNRRVSFSSDGDFENMSVYPEAY